MKNYLTILFCFLATFVFGQSYHGTFNGAGTISNAVNATGTGSAVRTNDFRHVFLGGLSYGNGTNIFYSLGGANYPMFGNGLQIQDNWATTNANPVVPDAQINSNILRTNGNGGGLTGLNLSGNGSGATRNKIAVIGDSTAALDSSGWWTNLLQQYPYFAGWDSTNIAVGGTTTYVILPSLYTITNWLQRTDPSQKIFCVVMGGNNDAAQNPPIGVITFDETWGNLSDIYSTITNCGAVPIATTIWMGSSSTNFTGYPGVDMPINYYIRSNYNSCGARLADLEKVMNPYQGMTWDVIHPNALGNHYIAQAIDQVIEHPSLITDVYMGTNGAYLGLQDNRNLVLGTFGHSNVVLNTDGSVGMTSLGASNVTAQVITSGTLALGGAIVPLSGADCGIFEIGKPTGTRYYNLGKVATIFGGDDFTYSSPTLELMNTNQSAMGVGATIGFGGENGGVASPYPFAMIGGYKHNWVAGDLGGDAVIHTMLANGTPFPAITIITNGDTTFAGNVTIGLSGSDYTTRGIVIGPDDINGGGVISLRSTLTGLFNFPNGGYGFHAFEDRDIIDFRATTNLNAWASISLTPTIVGTNSYDHVKGLQSWPTYNSSGNLTNMYGADFRMANNGPGTVIDAFGVYVWGIYGSGPVANYYGLFVPGNTPGRVSGDNYGLYAADNLAKNYIAGSLGIGGTVNAPNISLGTNGSAIITGDIGIGTATSPLSGSVDIGGKYIIFDSNQMKIGDYGIVTGGGSPSGDSDIDYYTSKSFKITKSGTIEFTLDSSGNATFANTVTASGYASTSSNTLALASISFPATTVNWTNTFGKNIFVFINNAGVTGTALSINGTQIASTLLVTGDTMIPLQPGEYFAETYTVGTPVAVWKPF